MNGAGHPARLAPTPGQHGDAPLAPLLLAGLRRGRVRAVVGDRGYDSDANVRLVRRLRARVVIPPLGCRRAARRYSKALYRARNVAERFWAAVKRFRRVATRYDKLDSNYMGFVHLASIMAVLRSPGTVHTA